MDTSRQRAGEILEAALDDAFTAPEQFPEPVLHVNHAPVAPQPTISQTASGTDAEQGSSSGVDDAWKEEYEAQLQTWRAQSAEQREKAEKERLRWEAIRAQEKDEAERRKSAGQENWERVDASASNVLSTPASSHDHARKPSSQEGTPDDIQKWENVPSDTSPSPFVLPEPAPSQPTEPPQKTPVSVTLSIFDSSLSTRTRILAFASSMAMNLVLPFINGVMLGFGELFARHVVTGWFGWKIPAINVGLRANRGR